MRIFDKFKKKEIITFSDQWDYYSCMIDDKPCAIHFDPAVENLSDEDRKQYPHTIEIRIPYNEIKENGFPTSGEMKRINKIQDELFAGDYNIRLIGAIVGDGHSHFIFCSDVANDDVVETLVSKNESISSYLSRIHLDDNFEEYYQTISPDIYERQLIMNRIQCQQLKQGGDDFSKERLIDFYINFESDVHIQNISEKLSEQGFCVVGRDKLESGIESLHFTIEGIPNLDSITDITYDIIDLLEETDGVFDGWGCLVIRRRRKLMQNLQKT